MKNIYIISGPAGVGQGTIIKELLNDPALNLHWVKGYTSRAERPSDMVEQKYQFISKEEFERLTKTGEIFEWTLFNHHYYGTSKKEIEKILNDGFNAIRDVDPIDGGKFYRKIYPEATLIFIRADLNDIRQRLISRGQNTPEEIEERLEIAKKELECAPDYDYVITNTQGQLKTAVAEVSEIIKKKISIPNY